MAVPDLDIDKSGRLKKVHITGITGFAGITTGGEQQSPPRLCSDHFVNDKPVSIGFCESPIVKNGNKRVDMKKK